MQNSAAVTTPFTGDSRMRSMLGATLLALCALPLTVVAAPQAPNPVTNGVRAMTQRQTKYIVEAAEEMPADKAGYKPTPAPMSFGAVAAHLIKEGNNYLCSAASGMKQPDADKFSGTDPKDKLVPARQASFSLWQHALGPVPDAELGRSIDLFGGRTRTQGMAALLT